MGARIPHTFAYRHLRQFLRERREKTGMTQRELALRFLTRTRSEMDQMRACLPDTRLPIEPLALAHLESLAAKISSAADAFGFPEIAVIAGAIELLSQVSAGRTVRERIEMATRLGAQLSALEVHVEYELAERERIPLAETVPLSAHLPGFRARK
jgi:HPt (histidine-containing phosphotransfer) domain-containing protein